MFQRPTRKLDTMGGFVEATVTPHCNGLDIIPMQAHHFDEVLGIEAEAFETPWTVDDFEYGLREDKGGYSVVAVADGAVAGYAVGFIVFEEFHLANLAVGRDWRGRGFGSCLLDRVLQDVQKAGVIFVTLEVRPSNLRAIELYRQNAFRDIAIRKEYYRHPQEDALVMMRVLEGGLFYKQLEERHGLAG